MKISILTSIFWHEIKEIHSRDRFISGGAEVYLIQLCKFLQQEGHEVTVYQGLNGIAQYYTKKYDTIPITCIPLNAGWPYTTNIQLNMVFNEFASLSDLRIYFATFLCYPQVISPCIAISHGIFWDFVQNEFKNYNEADRKEFFRRQMYGYTTPDAIVSVDDNVPNVIRAMEPGAESKIHVIYNFADCNVFKPVQKTWEGIKVLSPRRLTMIRGCNDFIKASRDYPQYQYLSVGQAHDENGQKQLQDWANTTPHIKFITKPMEEMYTVYQESDICVIPTKGAEGTSLSGIEAMASGLPLIMTAVGGLPNLVIPGYNALVYNPFHENLGDYIDAMAQDAEMRKIFGERNREIAVECFDIEIWRQRWRNLLAQFGAVPEKQYPGVAAIYDESTPMTEKQWNYLKEQHKSKEIKGEVAERPDNCEPGIQEPGSGLPQVKEKTQGEMAGDALRKVLKQMSDVSAKSLDEGMQAFTQAMKALDNSTEYKKVLEANKDSYSDISKGLPAKSTKPKLVAMMLTHNEAGRYLERVIENTLLFCDEITILDDHSDDYEEIYNILDKIQRKHIDKRILFNKSESSWENESQLRKELLGHAMLLDPDWLIAIDADELYEADRMNEQLPYLMSQDKADWIGFRFFDMWDEEHYRDDDIWPAGKGYSPRMFRVLPEQYGYEWSDKRRHCGSVPANILKHSKGINSSVRVKHLGWAKPEDRERKYLERTTEDPNSSMFPRETYNAILDPSPTLVKWDDNNPWQTSKLTIAYPPNMYWNIMQQRPHHLLKLAAKDRYRVFFGDESAAGTYEVMPYLTLVKDWANCSYVENIDIAYITSFDQMKYLRNTKYKTLIYDCVDWAGTSDINLIQQADYVLCASKLLYERTKAIGAKNAIYIPNACDFDHFSRTGDPQSDIVGYMGAVTWCVDSVIISAIGRKWPTILIGETKGNIQNSNQNITMTGHVHYDILPDVLKQVKVGILPFQLKGEYTLYCAPIKIYEYLAAGRPVVASPIPELEPLAELGLIRLVPNDDIEGWVKAVDEAMLEYPNKAGQEYARSQTWDKRWKVIKEALGLK